MLLFSKERKLTKKKIWIRVEIQQLIGQLIHHKKSKVNGCVQYMAEGREESFLFTVRFVEASPNLEIPFNLKSHVAWERNLMCKKL